MKTVYRLSPYSLFIEERTLTRETEHNVWLATPRRGDERFLRRKVKLFDTFDEAKGALLEREHRAVTRARAALADAEEQLEAALAMTKPVTLTAPPDVPSGQLAL